jgi:hypothetical protein
MIERSGSLPYSNTSIVDLPHRSDGHLADAMAHRRTSP